MAYTATQTSPTLLQRSGMATSDATRINAFARGHPLALTVAASALTERAVLDLEVSAIPRMIDELAKVYLADLDFLTRRALDSASVVRRSTVSVLRAMLPEASPHDAYARLQALPFVESVRDGLMLHETMQNAIAQALRAGDPEAHFRYRRAAWRQLRTEMASAPRTELWRYTADILYLIDNPAVREAFFPSSAQPLVVEPALPSDHSTIREIAEAHEEAAAAEILDSWWNRHQENFRVARDPDGEVQGFYLMLDPQTVGGGFLREDPVTRSWIEHLRRDPIPKGQRVLFHRRRLSREHGEGPGPVQAACYLDMKRVYLEMRPALRRVYTVRSTPPAATQDALGFRALTETIRIDGSAYHATVLDFGQRR